MFFETNLTLRNSDLIPLADIRVRTYTNHFSEAQQTAMDQLRRALDTLEQTARTSISRERL